MTSTTPGSTNEVRELPDGPADDAGLTPRQRKVLEVIKDAIERRGYPPSMREIGEAVGLASPSSVSHQLRTLEAKGFLRRDANTPRAIEVRLPEEVLSVIGRWVQVELASCSNAVGDTELRTCSSIPVATEADAAIRQTNNVSLRTVTERSNFGLVSG